MAKQNITDRVKTYADACAVLGIKETLPDVGGLRPKDRPSVTAYYKLIVIAQALNEGWEPDWTNEDQPKWFPWFYFDREKNKTAGFAFAYTNYAPTSASAYFGSRLCFKTEALCAYAARQFEPLYEAWILYPNDVNPASDDTTRRDQEGAEKVGASGPAPENFAEALKAAAALIEAAADRCEDTKNGYILIGGSVPKEGGQAEGTIEIGGNKGITLRMLAEFLAAPQTQELVQEAIDRAGGLMFRRQLSGGNATYSETQK